MFQAYRRHRLGMHKSTMQDALDAIAHQQTGDVGRVDYDVKIEEYGYQVYRTHSVGKPVDTFEEAVSVGGPIQEAAKFMRGDWFVRVESEG